jgi:hypothetical protein
METPITPAGGKLLSCELDEACPILDCDHDFDDYAPTLLETPDGADFVAHYCGLEYLGKWSAPARGGVIPSRSATTLYLKYCSLAPISRF